MQGYLVVKEIYKVIKAKTYEEAVRKFSIAKVDSVITRAKVNDIGEDFEYEEEE